MTDEDNFNSYVFNVPFVVKEINFQVLKSSLTWEEY
jgi:hypothetical protein